MITHSSRKDYECKLCGTSFRTKGSLIRHHRRHTGKAALQNRSSSLPARAACGYPAYLPVGFIAAFHLVLSGDRGAPWCVECWGAARGAGTSTGCLLWKAESFLLELLLAAVSLTLWFGSRRFQMKDLTNARNVGKASGNRELWLGTWNLWHLAPKKFASTWPKK